MSSTQEPDYIRRRRERQHEAKDRESAEGDTRQRNDYIQALDILRKEIQSCRSEQRADERKKFRVDITTALAAALAAALSLGNLLAFVLLTLKTDSTAWHAVKVSADQLQQMRDEQRAFITVDSATITLVKSPDGKRDTEWQVNPVLVNSGNSPTRGAREISVIGFRNTPGHNTSKIPLFPSSVVYPDVPTDPQDDWDLQNKDSPQIVSRLVMGPHAKQEVEGGRLVIGYDGIGGFDSIVDGKDHAWVYGMVRYKDVFPDAREHVTKFCYAIGAVHTPDGHNKAVTRLCRHWNCADDECKDDRAEWEAEVRAAFSRAKVPMPPIALHPYTGSRTISSEAK